MFDRFLTPCKHKNLQIDDNIPLDFLVEKLLQEPLSQTEKEVFIIIDGVDEADWATIDFSQHPARPELEALVHHIDKIPSVRLLFMNKPTSNLSKILSNLITKSIGKHDNRDDINAYL